MQKIDIDFFLCMRSWPPDQSSSDMSTKAKANAKANALAGNSREDGSEGSVGGYTPEQLMMTIRDIVCPEGKKSLKRWTQKKKKMLSPAVMTKCVEHFKDSAGKVSKDALVRYLTEAMASENAEREGGKGEASVSMYETSGKVDNEGNVVLTKHVTHTNTVVITSDHPDYTKLKKCVVNSRRVVGVHVGGGSTHTATMLVDGM